MQRGFTDRTYLVTGGGSGIGKGVAAGLAGSGADVVIVGRNAERLAGVAEEITARGGGTVRSHPADVTDEEQVERAVADAAGWHDRLHGVVHCAGGSQFDATWYGIRRRRLHYQALYHCRTDQRHSHAAQASQRN